MFNLVNRDYRCVQTAIKRERGRERSACKQNYSNLMGSSEVPVCSEVMGAAGGENIDLRDRGLAPVAVSQPCCFSGCHSRIDLSLDISQKLSWRPAARKRRRRKPSPRPRGSRSPRASAAAPRVAAGRAAEVARASNGC